MVLAYRKPRIPKEVARVVALLLVDMQPYVAGHRIMESRCLDNLMVVLGLPVCLSALQTPLAVNALTGGVL